MNISNIYKYFNTNFNKYNPYFTSIELGGFAENHNLITNLELGIKNDLKI